MRDLVYTPSCSLPHYPPFLVTKILSHVPNSSRWSWGWHLGHFPHQLAHCNKTWVLSHQLSSPEHYLSRSEWRNLGPALRSKLQWGVTHCFKPMERRTPWVSRDVHHAHWTTTKCPRRFTNRTNVSLREGWQWAILCSGGGVKIVEVVLST